MIFLVIFLLCLIGVFFRKQFFFFIFHFFLSKSDKGMSRQTSAPPKPISTTTPASLMVLKHYVTGHRRPETAQPGMSEQFEKEDAIFAPASEEKSAMQGWNTLVVQPPIGEDGELSEPEAPTGARPPRPALPAKAELRDAEVYAMLGELDFGECAIAGDATAEERQAIANFDIRAYA